MFPNLLKMVQVKRLKLLRIRLWGCITGLLVPPNGVQARQLPSEAQPELEPFKPLSLSKLSMGLTGPIGLVGPPR